MCLRLGQRCTAEWYRVSLSTSSSPQPHPDLPSQELLTILLQHFTTTTVSTADCEGGQKPSCSMGKGNQGFPFQTKVSSPEESSIIRFKAFKEKLHNLHITEKCSILLLLTLAQVMVFFSYHHQHHFLYLLLPHYYLTIAKTNQLSVFLSKTTIRS